MHNTVRFIKILWWPWLYQVIVVSQPHYTLRRPRFYVQSVIKQNIVMWHVVAYHLYCYYCWWYRCLPKIVSYNFHHVVIKLKYLILLRVWVLSNAVLVCTVAKYPSDHNGWILGIFLLGKFERQVKAKVRLSLSKVNWLAAHISHNIPFTLMDSPRYKFWHSGLGHRYFDAYKHIKWIHLLGTDSH